MNKSKQTRNVEYWETTNVYVLLDPENTVASVKAKYEKIQKRVMVELFKVKFLKIFRRSQL